MPKYAERREVLKPFEIHRDYMEERVREGVERNRKSWFTIETVDINGIPVKGAEIRFNQKTHDFLSGANIFMLDEMESEEKNRLYREMFADCFNLATIPFYWNDLEPEQGQPRYAADSRKIYRRPAPGLCLKYCKEHGITPKAHCLNYDQHTPRWVPRRVGEMKQLLNKRFGECAEEFAAAIPGWEVTNETLHWNGNPTPFFLEEDFVSWSFRTAERHFPMNELIINEASDHVWTDMDGVFKRTRNKYFQQCRLELEHGTPIDAIGMQYHMFFRAENELKQTAPYYNPRQLYSVMDTFAQLGKPLQVTEITVPAYSWNADDEEIQAEILRNLYSIWFSHEAMEAVVYWNLVDGYAYMAEPGDMSAGENYYYGGLVRFDMSKKPAYYVLRDLFKKTWHTAATVSADSDGLARVKGFYGKYDAEIVLADGTSVQREVWLAKDGGGKARIVI